MKNKSILSIYLYKDNINKSIIGAYNYKHYLKNNNFPSKEYKQNLINLISSRLNIIEDIDNRIKEMTFCYNEDKSKLFYSYNKQLKIDDLELFLLFNDNNFIASHNILKTKSEKLLEKFELLKSKHFKFIESLCNNSDFIDFLDTIENLQNWGYEIIVCYKSILNKKPSVIYQELKRKRSA